MGSGYPDAFESFRGWPDSAGAPLFANAMGACSQVSHFLRIV